MPQTTFQQYEHFCQIILKQSNSQPTNQPRTQFYVRNGSHTYMSSLLTYKPFNKNANHFQTNRPISKTNRNLTPTK